MFPAETGLDWHGCRRIKLPKFKKLTFDKLGAPFNRLWGSTLSSHMADGILATAAPLLAATLTKDPILISGLAATVMLPWLMFGIPIGGLIDRLDRRMVLAVAAVIRLTTAALLAWEVGQGTMTIWWLYVAAFLIGTTEVFSDTAMQSLMPQVLTKNHIERGNARVSVAHTVLQSFIGAPLGGALYAFAIWLPFFVNIAAYAVSALLIILVPVAVKQAYARPPADPDKTKTSFVEDIKIGIKFLLGHKVILRLVLITTAVGFAFAAATSTMVLYLLDVHNVPEALFGVLLTVQGVTGVFGGMQAPYWSAKFGRSPVLAASIVGSITCTFLTGFAPDIFVFLALGMINSYLISIWNVLLMSTYHELIPNELFGRVHGTRRTLVWGMMPIGSLVGGWLATFDLRTPFWVAGGFGVLIALGSLRFLARLK